MDASPCPETSHHHLDYMQQRWEVLQSRRMCCYLKKEKQCYTEQKMNKCLQTHIPALAETWKDLFHSQTTLTGNLDTSLPPLPGTHCILPCSVDMVYSCTSYFPYQTVISWRAGAKPFSFLSATAPTYNVPADTSCCFPKWQKMSSFKKMYIQKIGWRVGSSELTWAPKCAQLRLLHFGILGRRGFLMVK